MKKLKLLVCILVLVLPFSLGAVCSDGDGDGKVEPTPTPLPFSVSDDADGLVQGALEGREKLDEGLDFIDRLNCSLGFSTCLTVTGTVTPTVDLWGGD